MKRSLPIALIVGVIAGGVMAALHASGVILRFEVAAAKLISQFRNPRPVGDAWQYTGIFLLPIAIAWLTVTSARRGRIGWLALILLVELAGLTWICSLYRILFQPLPCMGAVL